MALVAANDETDQADVAASDSTSWPPAAANKLLDPRLLVAARRGDSKRLKELLRLVVNDGDGDGDAEAEENAPEVAATSEVIIVEVVPRRPPPAAAAPPPSRPPLVLDGVTTEGDTLLHVVAASGDSDDFLCCARMIVAAMRQLLLEAGNHEGDMPLHCAAAAGNANMISCLVDLIANTDDEATAAASVKALVVRMRNKRGETALHQAVRAPKNKVACVDLLMDMDPDLACFPYEEDGGASPLYLAISLGEVEIARHIYGKSKGKLSYSGPYGRNVLHTTVSLQHQELPMVLGWLKEPQTVDMDNEEGHQVGGQRHVMRRNSSGGAPPGDDDLLSQLTSQRDKMNGSTPLHLAASLGGLPSRPATMILLRPPAPEVVATTLLLDANESSAYQPDNEGLYPIHVAAGAGSINVVKILLGRCSECATLRDAKGRTFLHIAVEEGRYLVVAYVCRQSQSRRQKSPTPAAKLLSSILNAQDINGDTPLHRAVHAGNPRIFNKLVGNPLVRLDVPNKEGMRPIDVSWSKMPLKVYYSWDPTIHIRRALLAIEAPYGECRGDRYFNQKRLYFFKEDENKELSDELANVVQVLAILSALITTVTFASAFTLPGGYRSAGDDSAAGTPLLAGSYAFDAFVLSDALAFICSFLATILLLIAGVPARSLDGRFNLINLAYSLITSSATSLVVAFGLGLYVVLLPVDRKVAIAIAVCVWVIIFATVIFEASESESIFLLHLPVIARSLKLSKAQLVLRSSMAFVLGKPCYWTLVLIFALPAPIHKWTFTIPIHQGLRAR